MHYPKQFIRGKFYYIVLFLGKDFIIIVLAMHVRATGRRKKSK